MAIYRRNGKWTKSKKPYKRVNKYKVGSRKISSIVKKEVEKMGAKPEVKRYDVVYLTTDATIGQVAGNANAYYAGDVNPVLTLGSNANQRVGNRVAIKSAYITIQLRQMSAVSHPTKVKFFLFFDNSATTDAASTVVTDLFNYNDYIGTGNTIYDYNSNRNIDYLTSMQLVKTWTSYMRADSVSGQNNSKTYGIGLKFKKPKVLAWFANGSTNYSTGRFYLMAFCDSGNASTTTASTLANVPITAVNTGLFFNYNVRWYYTDV